MEIFLDSFGSKRIDLNLEFNSATYETKQRRFVVRHQETIRAFENFLEAVEYYRSVNG